MSRNGLGKGLGDLMNGDPVAGKTRVVSATASTATTATTTSTAVDTTFGRGLTTLVSPHRGAEASQVARKPRELLAPWFFFTADLLLLAYVVAITFQAPRPFDLGTILFCAVSVALGCILALIGLIRAVNSPR